MVENSFNNWYYKVFPDVRLVKNLISLFLKEYTYLYLFLLWRRSSISNNKVFSIRCLFPLKNFSILFDSVFNVFYFLVKIYSISLIN